MKSRWISSIFNQFHHTGKKAVALLVDPGSLRDEEQLKSLVASAVASQVDFFFVGGSLVIQGACGRCISLIKEMTGEIPIVLFPGSAIQIAENADGILLLSLISGRNPEWLIGQHVMAAPFLMRSSLEVLPTGYMLVDGGGLSSVNYVSQTIPLPNNKPDLAIATALAGILLGLQFLFLDAGSGAKNPVSPELIAGVKAQAPCPLIVGGGINSVAKAKSAWEAGADVVVLGNGVEKNPNLLIEVLASAQMYNLTLNVN